MGQSYRKFQLLKQSQLQLHKAELDVTGYGLPALVHLFLPQQND